MVENSLTGILRQAYIKLLRGSHNREGKTRRKLRETLDNDLEKGFCVESRSLF